jgi:hypothetical protein
LSNCGFEDDAETAGRAVERLKLDQTSSVDSSEPSPTTKPYSQSPPNNLAAERYLVHAYESIGHEERQLVDRLCKLIADEKDPVFFNQLVKQLDEVISKRAEA